jgi:hypothetical protein
LGDGVASPRMNVTVPRSEAANSVDSDGLFVRPTTTWGQCRLMFQKNRDEVIKRAYGDFWKAKEALAALDATIEELSKSSSITTDEGYLMLAPSGVRLLNTDYPSEVAAQYRAAKRNKEALRKRLMDLGEPDPE